MEWFESSLGRAMAEMEDLMGKFRISEALMTVYRLFWDEFSSWYLEVIKPAYGTLIDGVTFKATLGFFDTLRLLHPFMPLHHRRALAASRGARRGREHHERTAPGDPEYERVADSRLRSTPGGGGRYPYGAQTEADKAA